MNEHAVELQGQSESHQASSEDEVPPHIQSLEKPRLGQELGQHHGTWNEHARDFAERAKQELQEVKPKVLTITEWSKEVDNAYPRTLFLLTPGRVA